MAEEYKIVKESKIFIVDFTDVTFAPKSNIHGTYKDAKAEADEMKRLWLWFRPKIRVEIYQDIE